MEELKNKRILVVDDEPEILKMLEDILRSEGFFNIITAKNCSSALRAASEHKISLFLLDVNLPDGDGFSLFSEIRKHSCAPAIFLTARGEADDKIHGLGLGADDYIVKPFLPKELILRITALLRRTYIRNEENTKIHLSDRIIDFENAAVNLGAKTIPLTAKEYILLKKLAENKNKIVTSDALCMAAWGDEYYGYENTLMVHIRRLREKIEAQPSHPAHLITVKGLGYKLVVKNE